jgi:hypothetical protein
LGGRDGVEVMRLKKVVFVVQYIVCDLETIALHEVLAMTVRWVETNRRKLSNLLKNKLIEK